MCHKWGCPGAHLKSHEEGVGVPGCEGPQHYETHFRAGQRTWKPAGVGVPGCEGPQHYETHFQAGQRTWKPAASQRTLAMEATSSTACSLSEPVTVAVT